MRKSILLVEDDIILRNLLKEVLESRYSVIEAEDCPAAMKRLKDSFQCAIIDFSLPGGDGLDIVNTLKEKCPTLPVIIVTAYSTEQLAVHAIKAGVTDYFRKPLSLRALLKRVCELLGDNTETPCGPTFSHSFNREDRLSDAASMFIGRNYRDPSLSIASTASAMNMSVSSFRRVFKQKFGKGFVSYLNDVRIRSATDLMKNNQLSLTEISLETGYRSIEYFGKVFKRIHGLTPKEFRYLIMNNNQQRL